MSVLLLLFGAATLTMGILEPEHLRPDLPEIAGAAVDALTSETCGARLLQRFGLRAPEQPVRVLYRAAGFGVAACRVRGVRAITAPGSRVVHLCASTFNALHPEDAREVLVHEWLHTLGLPEAPGDPSAPTSQQITAAVRDTCGGTGRSR